MTDLHSHILPGIDDGAEDIESALRLVDLEYDQGIEDIALTSHYNCEDSSIEAFLDKRGESFARLQERMNNSKKKICFKLGCEVYFSLRLLEMNFERLCLEGTNLLLLELPTNYKPPFFKEALDYFQSIDVVPLIAHVERYSYVLREPTLLAEWVEMGAYAQINAGTFLVQNQKMKMSLNFLKWGLAHVVASDTHSLVKRPPLIRQALEEIQKHLGTEMVMRLQVNAEDLFRNKELQNVNIHYPKQILGRWF